MCATVLCPWMKCHLLSCFIVVSEQEKRSQNVSAVAGSAVSLNCTLDVNCSVLQVRWEHYSPSYESGYSPWCRGNRTHHSVVSRGISVENDPANGWSMLTIPRVILTDGGRFRCVVVNSQCEMNFRLSVTGNNCIVWSVFKQRSCH